MQLLITGATGFIGSNLAASLAKRGYKVKALVRSIKKASNLFNGSNITFFEGDITKIDTLEQAIDPGDTIIHLAARYNDPAASYQMYWETNVGGTENLIKAGIAKSIRRFIHCSTIGVAMDSGNPPYDENSPYSVAPGNFYEVTKCEGEKLVLRYFREKNFPAVILRPAQPFGPGDIKKVKFYKMVKKGIVVGNGRVAKHLIYIDDLVNAFERAIWKDGIEGEVFIVGGKPVITLDEMIRWSAEELNVNYPPIRLPVIPIELLSIVIEKTFKPLKLKPPLYKSRLEFFTKSYFFNTDKARKILGFEPQVHIKDGIAKTVRWYRDNNLL